MNKRSLLQALDTFRQGEWWDENYESDEAFYTSPFSKFIKELHYFNPKAVCWWTYFAAKRITLNSLEEKECLKNIRKHLEGDNNVDLISVIKIAASNTQSLEQYNDEWSLASASSLENCVKYIVDKSYKLAVDCILDADIAAELCDRQFRTWFLEVAFPSALEKHHLEEKEFEREKFYPGGRGWKTFYVSHPDK